MGNKGCYVIKSFIKRALKNVIYEPLAKGSLTTFFQGWFNKILSQQLSHDRSYISLFYKDLSKAICNLSGSGTDPLSNNLDLDRSKLKQRADDILNCI